jgi:Gpi18-like mannosyltransferase
MIIYMGGYFHNKDTEDSYVAYPNRCSGYYKKLKTKTVFYSPIGAKMFEITPFAANALEVISHVHTA